MVVIYSELLDHEDALKIFVSFIFAKFITFIFFVSGKTWDRNRIILGKKCFMGILAKWTDTRPIFYEFFIDRSIDRSDITTRWHIRDEYVTY